MRTDKDIKHKWSDFMLRAMKAMSDGPIMIWFFKPFNSYTTREEQDESAN